MGTTPNYSLPYPELSDAPNGPGAFQGLAELVDTELNNLQVAIDALSPDAIPQTLLNAKGDLVVASADNTAARLGVGSNDQVLTADSAQATGVKWATPSPGVVQEVGVQTTGQTVTNSAVLVDSTGLQVTLEANSIYSVEGLLDISATGASTGGHEGTLVAPAGATGAWTPGTSFQAASAYAATIAFAPAGGAAFTNAFVTLRGNVITGVSGGVFKYQFAQDTATAGTNTSLNPGSYIMLTKLT